jgi:hypothetical protein
MGITNKIFYNFGDCFFDIGGIIGISGLGVGVGVGDNK